MNLKAPTDADSRASTQLSAIIEVLSEDANRSQLPTLEEVRNALENIEQLKSEPVAVLLPAERESALLELGDLIEAFGSDACAADFIDWMASEELSQVIDAALIEAHFSGMPTLGGVRAAMAGGLCMRLVDDGVLEQDDEASLFDEMDELIGRYGENQAAETFVRFD